MDCVVNTSAFLVMKQNIIKVLWTVSVRRIKNVKLKEGAVQQLWSLAKNMLNQKAGKLEKIQ